MWMSGEIPERIMKAVSPDKSFSRTGGTDLTHGSFDDRSHLSPTRTRLSDPNTVFVCGENVKNPACRVTSAVHVSSSLD